MNNVVLYSPLRGNVWPFFLFIYPGLLHVGDIIKEVNGLDVTNDPDALQEHMKMASGNVTLKIIPSYHNDYHNLPVSHE